MNINVERYPINTLYNKKLLSVLFHLTFNKKKVVLEKRL